MSPQFQVSNLGNDQYTINESGRTIAIITSQGYVDWLIYEPGQAGELITKLYKETHLSYTLGLKFELRTQAPVTEMKNMAYEVSPDGSQVQLTGLCESTDGQFASTTTAVLTLGSDGRYRWDLDTVFSNHTAEPIDMPAIEYNNVYPSKAGRCMLYAPTKEYSSTFMTDSSGAVWSFPHQHMMGYGNKIRDISFAAGSIAGFSGEPTGNPVVEVISTSHEPSWAICDMYYDLHCCAVLAEPLAPGGDIHFVYTVRYLTPSESAAIDSKAKPVAIDTADWQSHEYPRIELGMNRFTRQCQIDRLDDCSGFRPAPPQKVWDREVGHVSRGSLRITNDKAEQVVWGAEPPTLIPPGTTLSITGMLKTEAVKGKGAFIRVRYHTFYWHPEPHVDWVRDIESIPVTGTTDGWLQVTVPSLRVEDTEVDYLVAIEVVLGGVGIAWFTDVDIDLVTSLTLGPHLNLSKPLVTA